MLEKEWNVALQAGSSGHNNVVFLRTERMLLCGILGISLTGSFLSLGYSLSTSHGTR